MENRNALVEQYLGLVHNIANKLYSTMPYSSGHDLDDLVGYGVQGLIDCVDRFEPERGYKFSTFASRRVYGAMCDGLRGEDWVPRLERVKEKRGEVTPVPVESLNKKWFETDSLKDVCEIDLIVDRNFASPGDRQKFHDLLRDVTKGLNKSERLVVILYHVLDLTMKEIGTHLGLSESRVSQMHSEIIYRLRVRFGLLIPRQRSVTRLSRHAPRDIFNELQSGKTATEVGRIFGVSRAWVYQVALKFKRRRILESIGAR